MRIVFKHSYLEGIYAENNRLKEEAFGSHPKSLGIVIVRDLPPAYVGYREKLLKLAYRFAKLNENVREKYADPASRYRCARFIRGTSILQLKLLDEVLGGRTGRYATCCVL